MEFSVLPWLIRRDIINLVIEKRAIYGLVSKEWAKQVAVRHGELRYFILPEREAPISVITQQARKVEFQRCEDINWNVILNNKNIDNLSFGVSCEETSKASKELFSNCQLLPSIKRLKLNVDGIIPLGPKLIIEKNQIYLEGLTLLNFSDKWHLALKEMAFPNLRLLDLLVGGNPLHFIETVSRFPKLNSLKLHCSIPQDPILFNNHKLPSITELSLTVNCESSDGATRVNLVNLPNLRKLQLKGNYNFIGENDDNNIKFLETPVGSNDLSWLTSVNFLKLKTLSLRVEYLMKPTELDEIFHFFKNLTNLQLDLCLTLEIPISLSVGSFNLTTLCLKGYFEVTSDLLYWLSNSFKLKRLSLHGCRLEEGALSKLLPFDHLFSIQIESHKYHLNLYKNYFSNANYPHTSFIELNLCKRCGRFVDFF